MWSLLSNIQRPIVKQKVHIYIPIVQKITFIGLLFLFIQLFIESIYRNKRAL